MIPGSDFLTALSVPLEASSGLPVFTAVTSALTVALAVWGVRRAAHGTGARVADRVQRA